ncbi:MAG: TAXI family TRAP transporter solute-binding subunit [Cyanobacteria bacterium P01_H01_bin.15]
MNNFKFSKIVITLLFISFAFGLFFSYLFMRERRQVHTLTISTAGKEGAYYNFATALSKIIAKHHSDINLEIATSEGSRQNADWVDQGKVDLALVQSDTPLGVNSRLVHPLFPEIFHLLATQESRIKRPRDLIGKRIALMPRGSGSYALFWLMMSHYDLSEDDFEKTTPQDYKAAAQSLINREADALFYVGVLRNPTINELVNQEGIRIIPIYQGDALQLTIPATEKGIIPEGAYDGSDPLPPQDTPSVAVRALLIANKNVDSSLIYRLTQSLYEFRSDIVRTYPQATSFGDIDVVNRLGLFIHPGSDAYLNQERPVFIVEYAEPIGLIISVMVLCASSIWQFRLWLKERQKDRADLYNLEILELIELIENTKNIEELDSLRKKLFDVLAIVIKDLDNDRISSDSFQSFTFPWEVALKALHHRENLLKTNHSTEVI